MEAGASTFPKGKLLHSFVKQERGRSADFYVAEDERTQRRVVIFVAISTWRQPEK